MINSVVIKSTQIPVQQSSGIERATYQPHLFNKASLEGSPDNPEFFKHGRHVFVMTTAGRPIYVRYGDELKSSIFIATLNAIIQKFLIFYSNDHGPQQLTKVRHHNLTLYLLLRKQIIYCVASKKMDDSDYLIYSLMEFLNTQIISCVTDNVNLQLASRSNYDPRGLLSGTQNLLSLTIKNGINSPCILLNSICSLPMNNSLRSNIHNTIKEAKNSALCTLLLNETQIIDIYRKKDTDFFIDDILLIQNLIQAQSQLRKSEHWIPICLPGLSAQGMVQAYIHFFHQNIAIVFITDDSSHDNFFALKESSKEIIEKFTNTNIISSIITCLDATPTIPKCLENQNSIKHFLVKHNTNQLFLPIYQPFGKQPAQYKKLLHQYAKQYSQFLQFTQSSLIKENQKQNYFSWSNNGVGLSQYHDLLIFFLFDRLIDLNQVSQNIHNIQKIFKSEDLGNFFILKQS